MPTINLKTPINAPVEVCFDLSRSIDLHIISTKHTGERAIAGVTSGLIGFGESVTWRARHFGVWQHLSTKITEYERLLPAMLLPKKKEVQQNNNNVIAWISLAGTKEKHGNFRSHAFFLREM